MQYRREIDGLRAIAVVPVIFFHAGFRGFTGGFVGVDVFFVISGYLITGILMGDLERREFSIARFYERRARRILPALFLVMLCCIPFAVALMLPEQFSDFARTLIAVTFFSSNVYFWRQSDYFAPDVHLNPLLHTWSLAVEEQFYLAFPLLLSLLWKLGKRRALQAIAGLGLLSFLLSQWASIHSPHADFYLAPTRAWELAAGAICAFLVADRGPKSNSLLAGLGLALILTAVVEFGPSTPFPGGYALLPVGGTALIVLFADSRSAVGRLLGARLLVGIGLISYSAYLWHQPLFAFARIRSAFEPSVAVFSLLILASLALAYLSWRYVERPFRRPGAGPFPTRRGVLGASAAATLAIAALGLFFVTTSSLFREFWIDTHRATVTRAYELVLSTPPSSSNWGQQGGRQDLSPCRFNAHSFDRPTMERMNRCYRRFGPGDAVLGDSHAIDLFGELASRFKEPFLVGLTQESCRPQNPGARCQYARLLAYIRAHRVLRNVIFEEAGFYLLQSPSGEPFKREMITTIPLDGALEDANVNFNAIATVASYLQSLSRFVPVTWLGPRLEPHFSNAAVISHGCAYPFQLRRNQSEVYSQLDNAISQIAARHPGVRYVSQIRLMKYSFPTDFMDCQNRYWADGDHLSSAGEVRFGKRLPANFLDRPAVGSMR